MLSEKSGFSLVPLAEPRICGNEWRYLKECLDTGWVSSVGGFVDRFEREVADCVGVRHAIATVNGTASLHIALKVAGVEAEDEVLVSTLTFISPANAIRYVGAWPVFIDSEPVYWQMDPQRVVEFLDQECEWRDGRLNNKVTGRRIRAILPVHILGHPVDMDSIVEVAHKYNLVIIEDATEALGAQYKGRPVGQLGDIACFSFNGNKIITTGGGGMVVTDHEEWAQRVRYLTTQAKDDPAEYVHREIGYNYRLTNIQAAMGCAQLEQLGGFIDAKRHTAAVYTEALKGVLGITTMRQADWASSIWWLYTVLVDEIEYGMDSRMLRLRLGSLGIQSRPLWQPLHLSPAHTRSSVGKCPVAEQLFRRGLSIPCSVGLEEDAQARVIEAMGLHKLGATK